MKNLRFTPFKHTYLMKFQVPHAVSVVASTENFGAGALRRCLRAAQRLGDGWEETGFPTSVSRVLPSCRHPDR